MIQQISQCDSRLIWVTAWVRWCKNFVPLHIEQNWSSFCPPNWWSQPLQWWLLGPWAHYSARRKIPAYHRSKSKPSCKYFDCLVMLILLQRLSDRWSLHQFQLGLWRICPLLLLFYSVPWHDPLHALIELPCPSANTQTSSISIEIFSSREAMKLNK